MSNSIINSHKTTQGFSLVEVLIAVVIITLAILPVIMLSRSDNFTSAFNEGYLLALSRGKRISSIIEATGYRDLIEASGLSTPGAVGPLNNPLPEASEELKNLALENGNLSYLKHHEKKLSTYKETLILTHHEKGLLSVKTTMSWTIPGENNKLKEHHCTITTFVTSSRNMSGHKIEI